MPVLDTTFLIDLQRGVPAARRLLVSMLEGDEPIFVPIEAATEFAFGVRDSLEAARQTHDSFEVFPCDEQISREAVRLGRAAAARGRFPGWADLQIAATASYNGMALVSRDRRLADEGLGIRVVNY